MSPDARYREDQECWPHGRPRRIDPMSATATAISKTMHTSAIEITPDAHEAAQEARRAILRRIERLRCARDAITQEIADHDRALDEMNGGGW